MTFTLMQPYFFPYIGHFALIHSVDHFMFFDDVQYKIKSWMVRNRVLNTLRNDSIYIRANVTTVSGVRSNYLDLKFEPGNAWKKILLSQLQQYKRFAPFYHQTMELVESVLATPCTHLAAFNKQSTEKIARWIGLTTPFSDFSSYKYQWEVRPEAHQWGLKVMERFGADDFINPPGGESFIGGEQYKLAGKRIGFIQPQLHPYCQKNEAFIPGLSILDVLMWNGKEKTGEMVKGYEVKWV